MRRIEEEEIRRVLKKTQAKKGNNNKKRRNQLEEEEDDGTGMVPRISNRSLAISKYGNEVSDDLTDAEIEYLTKKVAKERGSPVAFNPADITTETLKGLRPEIARGVQGLTETIEARMRKEAGILYGDYTHELDIAKQFLRGETVLFESDEQRRKTMVEAKMYLDELALAEQDEEAELTDKQRPGDEGDDKGKEEGRSSGGRKMRDSEEEAEKARMRNGPMEFEPVESREREELMERLVRGSYVNEKKMESIDPDHEKNDDDERDGGRSGRSGSGIRSGSGSGSGGSDAILSTVHRLTRINETYKRDDQTAFANKIKNVLGAVAR